MLRGKRGARLDQQLGEFGIAHKDVRIVGRLLGDAGDVKGVQFTVQRYDRDGEGGWQDTPLQKGFGPCVLVPLGHGTGGTSDRMFEIVTAAMEIDISINQEGE